jgi:hypothetical protein
MPTNPGIVVKGYNASSELRVIRNVDLSTKVEETINIRPLCTAYRLSGSGVLELPSGLGYSFLLKSFPVAFTDITEEGLFISSHHYPFESTDSKESRSQESDIIIVSGSSSMVRPSRECIRLPHIAARTVMHDEVEAGKEEGPPGLSAVELFCGHEVLQVFVICPDLASVLCSFDEVSPLL